MSTRPPSGPSRADQAVADLQARVRKALDCLAAADQPHWRRTQAATLCFAKLPLDPSRAGTGIAWTIVLSA